MKILILGGSGMLGHKLFQIWKQRFNVFATLRGDWNSYQRFRIFDKERIFENIEAENFDKIRETVKNLKPEVIVNAVGIIKQLDSSKNVIKTLTINSIFPHRLSELAEEFNARLICISTDCVFSGEKGNYKEEDIPDAFDLYGKSKNLGEVTNGNCLTIRTSIIGRELETSHSLVEWFLSNAGKKIKGYKTAIFSGFPTSVLAEILADVITKHKDLNGLYHVSSEPINKFDLLELIKKAYQIPVEIEPSDEVKIDRSLDSAKFRNATGFEPKSWEEMIDIMANDPTPYAEWRK
jgi:dTDP-4-dehydrorhamnose reductase